LNTIPQLPSSLRRKTYQNLRAIYKLIEAAGFDGRKLRKLGFVKTDVSRKYNKMFIYVNKELEVVLKYPNYLSSQRVISKYCIPSLVIRDPVEGLIVLQPIANLFRRKKISDQFHDIKYKELGQWTDLHDGNVGSYLGYPVLIDW
jgi:hypothetical protein